MKELLLKAPWSVGAEEHDKAIVYNKELKMVADCSIVYRGNKEEDNIENAWLIKHAPEMLAFLNVLKRDKLTYQNELVLESLLNSIYKR